MLPDSSCSGPEVLGLGSSSSGPGGRVLFHMSCPGTARKGLGAWRAYTTVYGVPSCTLCARQAINAPEENYSHLLPHLARDEESKLIQRPNSAGQRFQTTKCKLIRQIPCRLTLFTAWVGSMIILDLPAAMHMNPSPSQVKAMGRERT